jgi:ribosomal protein S18 acetylase RimI-like enzyme
MEKGQPFWDVHPDIKPEQNDIIIEKHHADAFFETELDETLKSLGATDLVITGLQTEHCVDTTCRRAYSLGYKNVLVSDGHSTLGSGILSAEKTIAHHNSVLGSQFACLATAAEACFTDLIIERVTDEGRPAVVPLDICANAEAAAELIRRSHATVAEEFALTRENCPSSPAFTTAPKLVERLTKPGCHCFGLYQDGALAGFAALMPSGSGEGGAYEVTRLAVPPGHRHKGYGRALMDAAIQKARELGARKVDVGIINDNAVLKRWYQSLGFVETATKNFPFLPFTVCYMEFALAD